jgi:ATP-binding protein involved in chromosome partitioning
LTFILFYSFPTLRQRYYYFLFLLPKSVFRMAKKEKVLDVLETVVHPEDGLGLVSGGFVTDTAISDENIVVTLGFRRPRDPFAGSVRRQALAALSEAFPGMAVSVVFPEPDNKPRKDIPASRRLEGVSRVVAVASGKGGVGKSTVTAGLARALATAGFRVGVLDADIYGPSQPVLFGVEDHLPVSEAAHGVDTILPAVSEGVKIMSIGLFISPSDALVWRGPMAANALRQLIRQTDWGELDYLLVDLPPGTGDVHLSIVGELELDGAVVVTTPGRLALGDVRRGVEMFRSEGIGIPVLGVVENMAWFSPSEMPGRRYFIFGRGGGREFARKTGIPFLGEIPMVMSADAEEKESGGSRVDPLLGPWYEAVAGRIVDKLGREC